MKFKIGIFLVATILFCVGFGGCGCERKKTPYGWCEISVLETWKKDYPEEANSILGVAYEEISTKGEIDTEDNLRSNAYVVTVLFDYTPYSREYFVAIFYTQGLWEKTLGCVWVTEDCIKDLDIIQIGETE